MLPFPSQAHFHENHHHHLQLVKLLPTFLFSAFEVELVNRRSCCLIDNLILLVAVKAMMLSVEQTQKGKTNISSEEQAGDE